MEEIRLSIERGRYAEAEAMARRRLAEVEARGVSESLAVADVLDPLVEALRLGGKSQAPETQALAERTLAIRERDQGPEHPDVATSLDNLCNVLGEIGAFERAEPICERAVAIREKAQGSEHPDVAMSLINLADRLRNMGERERAQPLAERAVAIAEKTLGPEDPKVALTLTTLGAITSERGDLERARRLFERALAIREKVLGPEHPDVAVSLSTLGWWFAAYLLDYQRAGPFFKRALAIAERTLGPEHPRVGVILLRGGTVHWVLSEYEQARPQLERAVAILERSLGPDHYLTGNAANTLGNMLRDLGEYEAARAHLERALAIVEKVRGPEHPGTARPLVNLAEVLMDAGEYAQARPLLERALAIAEKAEPSMQATMNQALALDLLARLAREVGEPARARALYEKALAISEGILGGQVDVAWPLQGLGTLLCDGGEDERARPLFERALAVLEKGFGPDNVEVARVELALAELAVRAGDPARGLTAALEAEAKGRQTFRLAASVLAEREALRYAAKRVSGLDVVLSVAAAQEDKVAGSVRKSWDALVRSRALVLDEMAARHRSFAEEPGVAGLVEALVSARQRLANLVVRAGTRDDPELYRKLAGAAREEKEQAERALAAKSRGFRNLEARSRLGLGEVAAALPPQSALVALVRYAHHSRAKREAVPSFLAFVLASSGGDPKLVPLGSAAEIEGLVSRWREEVARGAEVAGPSLVAAEGAYREAGEALRRKVWDPVAMHLGGGERVFVVPDGALQLVNIAALPSDGEGYLVETGPELHYLSAERDLVRPPREGARGEGLFVLADPDFEATRMFAAAPESAEPGAMPAHAWGPFRGARSGCGDFATLKFEPLAATRAEAEEVSALWEKGPGRGRAILALTGAEATEAAFKASAPGRRVLHVATHGFFLGGQCRPAAEQSRGIGAVGEEAKPLPARSVGENPLQLSGLVLAGANHRSAAGAEEEDGVVTAEEIAALDLSGVEWAVLSACDTGLGEIRSGEGVLGLRRAFEVAGAGTLVMSLWAVEDEAAREWMRALYEGRFLRQLEVPAAVREASLSVLHERRARGKSTHPSTWAGFVAAGDWR